MLDRDDVPLELTELLAHAEAERTQRGKEYVHINVCTSTGQVLSSREVAQLLELFLRSGKFLPEYAAVMITQVDLIRRMKEI